MRFSPHYYALSLSTTKNMLFEAFRDSLINVENQGFPICRPAFEPDLVEQDQRTDLARTVDEYFGRYYAREPLGLIVVGTPEMQCAFRSVTAHGLAVIGRIEGKYWSAVITPRNGRTRIISVRRARPEEIEIYEGA